MTVWLSINASNSRLPYGYLFGLRVDQRERIGYGCDDLYRELGCGFTLYGWDGDTLAWESSPARADGAVRTVHYLFEPGSFVPVAQALHQQPIRLLAQPTYEGPYDIDQDPLWTHQPKAQPFEALAWYQCDHLGTPLELTDRHGHVAWAAQYKAWRRQATTLKMGAASCSLQQRVYTQSSFLLSGS